jgi:dihydrofolate reductase
MMEQRKVVLYIAASLDGFIATEEHDLNWLLSTEGEGDNGYSQFYDTVDTILLGRVTYDWIVEYEHGNFPYKGKECYVFSRTKRDNNDDVTFVSEDIVPFIKDLKEKSGKSIWLVGGGELNNIFIKEDLIDELIINITPVLLGKGIPLFKGNNEQTRLLLKKITRHNQFAELHYDVIR